MAADKKAKEAEAAPAEGKAGGGKKKLIMIIAAVVLAAGGGGGWYFMKMQKAKANADDEEVEEVRAEAPSKKKAPIFLALDPFTVNLAGEQHRFAQVAVTFDIANAETSEALKAIMPAVRDKVLRVVSSKSPAELLSPDGKDLLSHEIATSVATLIGWEPPDDELIAPKKDKVPKSKNAETEEPRQAKSGKGAKDTADEKESKAEKGGKDEAEADAEDDEEAAAKKAKEKAEKLKAAKRAKARKRFKPNPINEVHFAQFIIQ